jgi:tetratricopeptide (TPR) repeat protein
MPGHAYLGLALLESGRAAEALPPIETARSQLDIVVVRTWLARAHLAAGNRDEAMKIVRGLERRRQYLPPYYMAALYAHLGNRDRAFRELDRAVEERTGALVWLRVDPAMDPLRSDPRYRGAERRVWSAAAPAAALESGSVAAALQNPT